MASESRKALMRTSAKPLAVVLLHLHQRLFWQPNVQVEPNQLSACNRKSGLNFASISRSCVRIATAVHVYIRVSKAYVYGAYRHARTHAKQSVAYSGKGLKPFQSFKLREDLTGRSFPRCALSQRQRPLPALG